MQNPVQPDTAQWFTATSIVSVGGATVIITVITNAIGQFTSKAQPKWIALICALALAFLAVGTQGGPHWYDWILAIPNACLLFLSALGLTRTAGRLGNSGRGAANVRPFFDTWL
jgi:hypothetical protein